MRAGEESQLKIRDYILMGGIDDYFLRAVGEGHHLHRDVVRAVRGNGRGVASVDASPGGNLVFGVIG